MEEIVLFLVQAVAVMFCLLVILVLAYLMFLLISSWIKGD